MDSQRLKKYKISDVPGVYLFKRGKGVLYVGKATSLKDRVRSYFASDLIGARGPFLVDMVFKATSIDWVETDSVLEALILEAELIKKFQPKYNTKEKDDRSFNCVVITKEDFPLVLVVRHQELRFLKPKAPSSKLKASFGPFPNGTQLKTALRIIRKIFPFRDNKCKIGQGRPCFNRQIGLCPGTCTGEISKKDYARTVRNLKLFFEGKKGALLKKLEREMKGYAKRQEFEKAALVRKTIFALNHIQDVALLKSEKLTPLSSKLSASFRIEAYDIAHLSGKNMVGVMVVVENGALQKSAYRKFRVRGFNKSNDIGALKEILTRRLNHSEWPLPDLIVVDGNDVQKQAVEGVLKNSTLKIAVVAVTKDAKHKPVKFVGEEKIIKNHKTEILFANSEAHRFAVSYYRKLERKRAMP